MMHMYVVGCTTYRRWCNVRAVVVRQRAAGQGWRSVHGGQYVRMYLPRYVLKGSAGQGKETHTYMDEQKAVNTEEEIPVGASS